MIIIIFCNSENQREQTLVANVTSIRKTASIAKHRKYRNYKLVTIGTLRGN